MASHLVYYHRVVHPLGVGKVNFDAPQNDLPDNLSCLVSLRLSKKYNKASIRSKIEL